MNVQEDETSQFILRVKPTVSSFNVKHALGSILSDAHQFESVANTYEVKIGRNELEYLSTKPWLDIYPNLELGPFVPDSLLSPSPLDQSSDAAEDMAGLDAVLRSLCAQDAWEKTTGEGAIIAVIDSGICDEMLEFPQWKRAGQWSFDGSSAWSDATGHGSMVAAIAAATDKEGGKGSGMAPDAKLFSCKAGNDSFLVTDLMKAYDAIAAFKKQHEEPLIINNSYGWRTCSAPEMTDLGVVYKPTIANDLLVPFIRNAVSLGAVVVFAAGNNHHLCGGSPTGDKPNSIWAWNSIDEVLSVGAVDQNNDLWSYSSRGPGQWNSSAKPKPDCVAPVYGSVLWGNGYKNSADGWGTSGAAPLVAGLAALIATYQPNFSVDQIIQKIKTLCIPHPSSHLCSGSGVISCKGI